MNARTALLPVLLAAAAAASGCSGDSSLDETRAAGDRILAALEAHREKTGAYPATLAKLVPQYLDPLPAPAWGTGKWQYSVEDDGPRLWVDESARTGDGNAHWYGWLGRESGWQLGD